MSVLRNIDSRIKTIRSGVARHRTNVQEVALMIVDHASTTGDCSRALTLCEAISTGDAKHLRTWFAIVSPINVTMSKEGNRVRLFKDTSPHYNRFDMDKARATEWWTAAKDTVEKEAETIHIGGVFEELGKFLKRVEKNETKGKTYSPEAVAAIAVIRADLLALQQTLLAERAEQTPTNAAHLPEGVMGLAA